MAGPATGFVFATVYKELAEVPTSTAVITALEVRLFSIFLSNVGAVDRTVTITNTAGVYLINSMTIPAYTPLPAFEFAGMYCDGLKWSASGAGINGQVEGYLNA